MEMTFRPLTRETWSDFEVLFGKNGACGGCWCMWWRMKRSEYQTRKGAENREAMRAIVEAGHVPGILAYADGRAVGWCSVAPREEFSALERSRVLKRVDETPVWSIVCFFVEKSHRRQGVTARLIRAAADYAQSRGAKVVEAYPVEPRMENVPDPFAFTGFASAFRQAGFVEVARRSETRPIMRLEIGERKPADRPIPPNRGHI